jgi:hypothetical protein
MAKLAIKTQNKPTSTFCNDPLDIKCHVVLITSFSDHPLTSYRYIMPNGSSYSRDLPNTGTGLTKCQLIDKSNIIGFLCSSQNLALSGKDYNPDPQYYLPNTSTAIVAYELLLSDHRKDLTLTTMDDVNYSNLTVQVKDEAIIGLLRNPAAEDLTDHFFIFLKLEQKESGELKAIGNFVGKNNYGFVLIYLTNSEIRMKQIFYNKPELAEYKILDPSNVLKLSRPADLVVLTLKFSDGKIHTTLVKDTDGYLGLGKNITTAEDCQACWSNQDIANWDSWDGKNSDTKKLDYIGRLDPAN